jgi:type IX secretion system PorP/SprF family membrane protein
LRLRNLCNGENRGILYSKPLKQAVENEQRKIMATTKTSILFLILFTALSSVGQDIHFTQFYASPLTLNPGNAGRFNGLFRVGANYRDQWRSVTVPYQTVSGFADVSIRLNQSFPRDRFGFGAAFVNDVAGDGQLHTTKVLLSTAYHKSFNQSNTIMGSVGFGVGFVQKKIDFGKLIFDAQWMDDHFDPTLPNAENYVSESLSYLDMQAGINFSVAINRNGKFYLGAAVLHINRPNESFYDKSNELAMRPMIQAGGYFETSKDMSVEPQVFFSMQKGAREIILGANMGWQLSAVEKNKSRLIAGAWYRGLDAMIGVLGIEISKWTLLGSYDLNLSKLTTGSKAQGAFELSLIYIADGLKSKPRKLGCPAFR